MHPTRKLVEFALRHQAPRDGDTDLSGPLFPRQRFFPSGLAHHRWLFTSPLTFTVVFEDVGMMFAESTLEHADGLTDGNRYSHERPEIMRLIEQCMPIYEPGYSGVIGSDCRRVVSDYCDAVRDAQGCATYRRYLSERDHSMDPG